MDTPFESFFVLLEGLRFFLILPRLGRRELFVYGFDLRFLLLEVKENLLALQI